MINLDSQSLFGSLPRQSTSLIQKSKPGHTQPSWHLLYKDGVVYTDKPGPHNPGELSIYKKVKTTIPFCSIECFGLYPLEVKTSDGAEEALLASKRSCCNCACRIPSVRENVCMHLCVHEREREIYIYIYIYIERERERTSVWRVHVTAC
jgi:hypothetical protein